MKSTKSQIAQSTNKAQNRDTQRTNFMKKSQSNQKGAGLIEVLAAVAVFTIGIMTVLHLYSGSYSAATHSTEKNQAILLAREGLEAVRSVRDENFESLSEETGGVELENSKWEIKTYSEMDIKDIFTREISIEETDENTRKITSTVSWEPLRGEPTSVILTEYLTNWRETYEIEYTLVVNSGQGGFVDFPGEDEFTFYYGDVVDIVAVADEGYEFDEWTGDTDNIDNIANSSTTITINDDYDITATFVEEEGGEE